MNVNTDLITQHRTENAKVFKKFAPVYDLVEFVVGGIRRDIAASLPPASYVLDVACGTGTQATLLAKQGHTVVGIDLSADMLSKALKKQRNVENVEFIERDATDTGFADGTFDAAMISFGLHDMPEEIAIAVLQEMTRATKQGGQLYILDYGQPAAPLLRRASRFVCGAWETDHYHDFMDKGINYYLAASNLKASRRQTFLSGIVELTVVDLAQNDFNSSQ